MIQINFFKLKNSKMIYLLKNYNCFNFKLIDENICFLKYTKSFLVWDSIDILMRKLCKNKKYF